MEPVFAFAIAKDDKIIVGMMSENQPDLENEAEILNMSTQGGGYRVIRVEIVPVETVN